MNIDMNFLGICLMFSGSYIIFQSLFTEARGFVNKLLFKFLPLILGMACFLIGSITFLKAM